MQKLSGLRSAQAEAELVSDALHDRRRNGGCSFCAIIENADKFLGMADLFVVLLDRCEGFLCDGNQFLLQVAVSSPALSCQDLIDGNPLKAL